jgi:hypothetical protein
MSTKPILIIACALTTAVASPALARTGSRSYTYNPDTGAFAQQQRRAHSVYRSRNAYDYNRSPYDYRGRYRGTDPDPFIRDQVKRCREC